MRYRTPSYMDKFHCIADKCKDSCCIGWEIDIDEKTKAYYDSVDTPFAERLKKDIKDGCFVLDEKERCPFLNDKNLCDIYINLGKEHLCQICSDHPRYYEWFGDLKEGGIGLSCEEAARVILSNDFSIKEMEIEEEEDLPDYDMEVFTALEKARDMILEKLNETGEKKVPLEFLLSWMLKYGKVLQLKLDEYSAEMEEIQEKVISELPEDAQIFGETNSEAAFGENPSEESPFGADAKAHDDGIIEEDDLAQFLMDGRVRSTLMAYFQTLEPMSTSWIPFLEMCDQVNRMHISDTKWLDEINSEKYEIYFRRLASYFIYRYFMKAVFDLDVAGKIKFAVLSTYMIWLLARCTIELTGQCDFEDLALLAKNYSKEIEYSEENLEKLM